MYITVPVPKFVGLALQWVFSHWHHHHQTDYILHLDLMAVITYEVIGHFLLHANGMGPRSSLCSATGFSFVTQHTILCNPESAGCLQISSTATDFKETVYGTKQFIIAINKKN